MSKNEEVEKNTLSTEESTENTETEVEEKSADAESNDVKEDDSEPKNRDLKKSDEKKKPNDSSSFFAGIQKDIIGTWIGAAMLVIALVLSIIWALDTLAITPVSQTDLVRNGFFVLIYILLGVAATLTIRSKGLDLSLPTIMLFASMMVASNPTPFGLITAVLLCVVLGAVNGALIVYLKINSVIVTLLTAIAFRGIMLLLKGFSDIILSPSDFEITLPVSIIITAIIIVAAILYTLFTHLKQPVYSKTEQSDSKSTNLTDFATYGLAGFIAGFAGIFLAFSAGGYSIINIFQPFNIVYFNYELFIFFVAFAAISSKLFDNKVMAIISAVLFSLAYSIIDLTCFVVLSLNMEAVFLVQLLFAVSAIIFAILSLYNKRTAAKTCACNGCNMDFDELVAGYDPKDDVVLTSESDTETAEESKQ